MTAMTRPPPCVSAAACRSAEEVGVAALTDLGEQVEDGVVPLGVDDAAAARVVRGEDVHRVAELEQVDRDRGRGGDRPLQAGARVGGGQGRAAGVEEEDGAAAGREVLLPDHELADAGGRRPVDPAQVVPVAVLADRGVVLAVERDAVRDRPLGAELGSAWVALRQGMDPGEDEDRGRGPVGRRPRGQPEGVLDADADRPEPVPSAAVRAHRVADDPLLAGRHGGHDEAGPVAERVVDELLGHEQRRAPVGGIAQVELHRARLVGLEPAGPGRPREREREVVAARDEGGGQRQHDDQDPEPGQVEDPGEQPGEEEHRPGRDECLPPGREDLPEPAHPTARPSEPGCGDRHPTEQVDEHVLRRAPRHLGLAGRVEPVREHGDDERTGRRRAARGRDRRGRRVRGWPGAGGVRPGGRRRGAGRGLAGGAGEVDDVLLDRLGGVDARHRPDQRRDGAGVGHGPDVVERVVRRRACGASRPRCAASGSPSTPGP